MSLTFTDQSNLTLPLQKLNLFEAKWCPLCGNQLYLKFIQSWNVPISLPFEAAADGTYVVKK
jgi:hypothetical protein